MFIIAIVSLWRYIHMQIRTVYSVCEAFIPSKIFQNLHTATF